MRPWNCELSICNWMNLLKNIGFEDIISLKSYNGANTSLIAKLNQDSRIQSGPTGGLPRYWIVFSDKSSLSNGVIDKLIGINFKTQSITWDKRDEIDNILASASTGKEKFNLELGSPATYFLTRHI